MVHRRHSETVRSLDGRIVGHDDQDPVPEGILDAGPVFVVAHLVGHHHHPALTLHLSRSGGTLAHADVLVVVMEASLKAVITARRTIILARELGIGAWVGVGNKVSDDQHDLLARLCADQEVPLDVVVPASRNVVEADRLGAPLGRTEASGVWASVELLADRLLERARLPVRL